MANFCSSRGDGRLGVEAHGGVGMLPVAVAAEPLELLALHVEPMLGIGAAFGAEGDHRLASDRSGLDLPLAR